MPRKLLRRIENPNHARYLTFSCRHRFPLFKNDRIKAAFVKQLDETRTRTRFHLLAWVIMPEHVHLLIWPKLPEHPISKVTWRLKRDFSRRIITRWRNLNAPILTNITDADGRTRFWQPGGGYDRNIVSDDELREKIDYIHANLVRRGLVDSPTDYPWSSARWYAGDRDDTLRIDPVTKPT
jgi:putative transposase